MTLNVLLLVALVRVIVLPRVTTLLPGLARALLPRIVILPSAVMEEPMLTALYAVEAVPYIETLPPTPATLVATIAPKPPLIAAPP